MRKLLVTLGGWLLCIAPLCAQQPASSPSPPPQAKAQAATPEGPPQPAATKTAPETPCDGKSAKKCGVSAEVFKQARQELREGEKLQRTDLDSALEHYEEAVRLVPRSIPFVEAREMVRQQLVYQHLQEGNSLAAEQRSVDAITHFRRVLELDPGNANAGEQLRNLTRAPWPREVSLVAPDWNDEEVLLHPKPGRQTFSFASDTKTAYSQIGKAFGVKVNFDDSVMPRAVRLELQGVSFQEAMNAVGLLSRTFWTPVSSGEVLVAADTPAKHKELDRWLLRSFYMPELSTPQEMSDMVNMLRTIFEIRFVTQSPATSTITVRAPAPVIETVTVFLHSFWAGRPQIMLDFDVYEISSQLMTSVGLDLPLQFNIFNISQALLASLSNADLQKLQQLILSGNLASIDPNTIQALLAQLQQQNSLFKTPVATFGGGKTLMGVAIPPASFTLSKNESLVTNVQRASLRAAQGNAATLRIGTRYPVMTASYSAFSALPQQIPGLLGSSLSSGVGTLGAFPSFSYEDLGLTIKAKPTLHDRSVTIELDVQMRSLGAGSLNGVPIINNRSYTGVITLDYDQPAVIAGAMSRSEQQSLRGLPGLSRIPLLGASNKQRNDDELLVVITPHVLRSGPTRSDSRLLALPKIN